MKEHPLLRAALLIAALCGTAATSPAVETKTVQDNSFSEFSEGDSTGTEMLSTGRLRVGPAATKLGTTDDALAWRVAVDGYDNSVFFATGHSGKVYRVPAAGGNPEVWADLQEPEPLSLAIDPTGGVLIGASPGGKIYRAVKAGKPELLFDTKEQYVWDMIYDRNGVLYAATGPNGKIFRIRGRNNGEVFYDSDETNVMALAFDREGRLLAATQGKGTVLRVDGPNSAYVLHAAKDDEVRALTVDNEGNIYAAVNGTRSSMAVERVDRDLKLSTQPAAPGAPAAPSPSPAPAPSAKPSPSEPSSPAHVVQIQPSGFAVQFWQCPEGPIHTLLADPVSPTLFVAAGRKGRIFRLLSDTNWSVVSDVDEPMVLSMAAHNREVYFCTAMKAALYKLGTAEAKEGVFASRALSAGSTVKWGNLSVEGEVPAGAGLAFETRTGNMADPEDESWSPWKAAAPVAPDILRVESPVAQYLQYRLAMKAAPGGESPRVDAVQFFYTQQNAAPVIRQIKVEKASADAAAAARATPPGGAGAPPTPPPDPSDPLAAIKAKLAAMATPAAGDPAAGRGVGAPVNSKAYRVTWEASDPNGDKLSYDVYLKAEDESVWKLVQENTDSNRIAMTTDDMPDGKYRLKIEASDAKVNAPQNATTSALVGQIFTLDNTPPAITDLKAAKVGKDEWEITARAQDALSILALAQYDVDAQGKPLAVFPEDSIFDFTSESFRFRVKPEKESAEHSLSVRVYDREGNSSVSKVLLK